MDGMYHHNCTDERGWPWGWLIATGIYSLAILALSLMRLPGGAAPSFPHMDKLAHFLAYAILAVLFYKAQTLKTPIKKRLFTVFVSACSYGVLMESLQLSLTRHRSFSLLDMLANLAGIIFALVLCALARPRAHWRS